MKSFSIREKRTSSVANRLPSLEIQSLMAIQMNPVPHSQSLSRGSLICPRCRVVALQSIVMESLSTVSMSPSPTPFGSRFFSMLVDVRSSLSQTARSTSPKSALRSAVASAADHIPNRNGLHVEFAHQGSIIRDPGMAWVA